MKYLSFTIFKKLKSQMFSYLQMVIESGRDRQVKTRYPNSVPGAYINISSVIGITTRVTQKVLL